MTFHTCTDAFASYFSHGDLQVSCRQAELLEFRSVVATVCLKVTTPDLLAPPLSLSSKPQGALIFGGDGIDVLFIRKKL